MARRRSSFRSAALLQLIEITPHLALVAAVKEHRVFIDLASFTRAEKRLIEGVRPMVEPDSMISAKLLFSDSP